MARIFDAGIELLCRDAYLPGAVGDGSCRHFLHRKRKARGVLKKFQQHGEAETSGTGLICQQRRLGRQKGRTPSRSTRVSCNQSLLFIGGKMVVVSMRPPAAGCSKAGRGEIPTETEAT